jgi:cytochrome b involved in lipid metabolism
MGIPVQTLVDAHEAHYQASLKMAKDPEGGPWPAYPSGKSWDEPSGKTGSGKKFYHNVIPGSQVAAEPFYVAIITPVIHYCMGGLEIDVNSSVLGPNGPIPGLYCAGEIAGGVHGNNRLGGNSLLDCVVFGRVAGKHCAEYMLGSDVKQTSLIELSGGGLSGDVTASKNAGGSYEDGMNKGTAAAGGAAAPAAAAAGGGKSITKEEVATHNSKSSCWVILNNRVLDVTDFLKDHPGGELAILTFAGKDATEEFDMIHPPDVIDKYLSKDAIIGMVGDGSAAPAAAAPAAGGGGKSAGKEPWYKGKMAGQKAAFMGTTVGCVSGAAMIVHSSAVVFTMGAMFWANWIGS